MPVTKTAKRALRGSVQKKSVNTLIRTELDKAIRKAKKSKAFKDAVKAASLADRAAKKSVIHKNKASRIKQSLAKLAAPPKATKKATATKAKKAK